MQIVALINQKSGVGKTTCTINIGAGLTSQIKRVAGDDSFPLLATDLEEKQREIIKEWIKSGRIEDINNMG